MDIISILVTVLLIVVIVLAIRYITGLMGLDPEARRILMLAVGGLAILWLAMMLLGYAPGVVVPRLR